MGQPEAATPEYLPDDLGELEQLCLGGRLDACDRGGFDAEQAGDTAKARDFYWFACERDLGSACDRLAGLESDEVQKRVLLEKGCRLGDGGACMMLGQYALTDERYDEALRYMQLACDSGQSMISDHACDMAETIRQR